MSSFWFFNRSPNPEDKVRQGLVADSIPATADTAPPPPTHDQAHHASLATTNVGVVLTQSTPPPNSTAARPARASTRRKRSKSCSSAISIVSISSSSDCDAARVDTRDADRVTVKEEEMDDEACHSDDDHGHGHNSASDPGDNDDHDSDEDYDDGGSTYPSPGASRKKRSKWSSSSASTRQQSRSQSRMHRETPLAIPDSLFVRWPSKTDGQGALQDWALQKGFTLRVNGNKDAYLYLRCGRGVKEAKPPRCPFRIKLWKLDATWKLFVMNDHHNHDLRGPIASTSVPHNRSNAWTRPTPPPPSAALGAKSSVPAQLQQPPQHGPAVGDARAIKQDDQAGAARRHSDAAQTADRDRQRSPGSIDVGGDAWDSPPASHSLDILSSLASFPFHDLAPAVDRLTAHERLSLFARTQKLNELLQRRGL